MEENRDNRKAIVTFLAIVIIAVIVIAAITTSPKKKLLSGSSAANTASTTTPSSTNSSASFKDGSYTATGSYESPGGTEEITINVTLNGGIITATSAESGAHDPDASSYQDAFISGYKSLVVGKKISDASLSRVSGSSLTSQGFNDAIQQIESKAKA